MPATDFPPPETISPIPPSPPDAWDDGLLRNPHAVADKRRRVQQMFAAIAPSYDVNNRIHSLGVDQRWRRKAVKLAELKVADKVVDVACGTGDLTVKFASRLFHLTPGPTYGGGIWTCDAGRAPPRVVGVDFTFEMLPIARRKEQVYYEGLDGRDGPQNWRSIAEWINGDAQALPLPAASADVVSIAFGIRNVQDPLAALREFRRVLRPGGRVIVLEFSLPTNPVLRGLYNAYFRHVLPRTATLVSGDKTGAYKYLPESVNTFVGRREMTGLLTAAGFGSVEAFPMTFGVCVCYRGVVPGGNLA